eukprot:7345243-Prymnesium_polylepis.1
MQATPQQGTCPAAAAAAAAVAAVVDKGLYVGQGLYVDQGLCMGRVLVGTAGSRARGRWRRGHIART